MKNLFFILLVSLLFCISVRPQVVIYDTDDVSNYYNYTAFTGTPVLTNTDVFLYGSFTRTKTTKLLGSKTASKYIVWTLDGVTDSTRTLALNIVRDAVDYYERDTIYWYCSVIAANGKYSKSAMDTLIAPMFIPTMLAVEPDTGKAYVNFIDESVNEDGFIIERKFESQSAANFTVIDTVAGIFGIGNVISYLDSPLVKRDNYTWRVRSFIGPDRSTYSDTASSYIEEWIPRLEFSPSVADFGLVYFSEDSIISDIDTTLGTSNYPVIESFTLFNSGGGNGNSTNHTMVFTRPTGIQDKDVMLIIAVTENDSSGTTQQYTMGNDWTYIGEGGNSTVAARIGAFYKVTDGTEDATDTVVANMGSVNAVGWWLRISGVDTSEVVNTFNFANSGGNATTFLIPSITTDKAKCLAISGLSYDGADATFTQGISWVLGDTTVSPSRSGVEIGGMWGYKNILNAGATGVDTVTATVSDGAAYFQLALNGISTSTTYDTTFVADRDTVNVTILNRNTVAINIDSTNISSIFTYTAGTIPSTINEKDSAHFSVFIQKDSIGGFNSNIKFYTEFTTQYYPLSATVFLPDTIAPLPPISISLTGGNKTALLQWENRIESSRKYILWSLSSSPNMTLHDSVGSNETNYTITGLDSGSIYKAGLIAYDDAYNLSDTSSVDTALVLGSQISDTAPPTGLTSIVATGYALSTSNDYITITATQGGNLSDVFSYTVMRSAENPSFTLLSQISHPKPVYDSVLAAGHLSGSAFTYTDTSVNQGSLYSYKIGVWDASGNGSWWSALNDTARVPYSEVAYVPQCSDGIDNDGDGFIDMLDAGCLNTSDDNETNIIIPPQCSDGIDNDGDGFIDMLDAGCSVSTDNDETNIISEPGVARFVSLNGGAPFNGLTWGTAYDYPSIPFATLEDNTILYFDGGPDSVIYPSPLTVSGNYLTITPGTSAGHNGRVIFQGTSHTSGDGITMTVPSGSNILGIKINGIEFRTSQYGITINSRDTSRTSPRYIDSLVVSNCRFTDFGLASLNINGVSDSNRTARNVYMINNYAEFRRGGNTASNQIDGANIKGTCNFFFIGNTVINYDEDVQDTHSDLVQGQWNTNQYYFNNFFYIANVFAAGQNGIQLGGNSAGDFYLANNIIMMGQYSYQSAIWAELFPRHWGNMRFVHNTVIGANPRFFYLGAYPEAVFKNNIFYSRSNRQMFDTRPFFTIETTDGSAEDLVIENNNFYYSASQIFMTATGSFPRPVSNGWYNTSTYTPTMVGFTYSPTTYGYPCPYSTNPNDYYITSGSTREWGTGETLLQADYPTNPLAPSWFKAWDYISKQRNGTTRTLWHRGTN